MHPAPAAPFQGFPKISKRNLQWGGQQPGRPERSSRKKKEKKLKNNTFFIVTVILQLVRVTEINSREDCQKKKVLKNPALVISCAEHTFLGEVWADLLSAQHF